MALLKLFNYIWHFIGLIEVNKISKFHCIKKMRFSIIFFSFWDTRIESVVLISIIFGLGVTFLYFSKILWEMCTFYGGSGGSRQAWLAGRLYHLFLIVFSISFYVGLRPVYLLTNLSQKPKIKRDKIKQNADLNSQMKLWNFFRIMFTPLFAHTSRDFQNEI